MQVRVPQGPVPLTPTLSHVEMGFDYTSGRPEVTPVVRVALDVVSTLSGINAARSVRNMVVTYMKHFGYTDDSDV
ncbi:MAG: hypothetical protein HOC77_03235 [Chloroflexi bacterium]|nr:hypothetical protein [Chloroflexota bacterium]